MESIHSRIKSRRLELGLSMQELAKKAGVSAWQTVQQWEKEGGSAPLRARLQSVADALKCEPEFLLYGRQARPDAIDPEPRKLSTDAYVIGRAYDLLKPDEKEQVARLLIQLGVL